MKPGDKVGHDWTGDEVGMGTRFNQVATEALSEKVTSKQSFTNKKEVATEIWGQSISVGGKRKCSGPNTETTGSIRRIRRRQSDWQEET